MQKLETQQIKEQELQDRRIKSMELQNQEMIKKTVDHSYSNEDFEKLRVKN